MKKTNMGAFVALGAGVGTALGAAFDNLGMGIALGVAIGTALGAAITSRNNDSDDKE